MEGGHWFQGVSAIWRAHPGEGMMKLFLPARSLRSRVCSSGYAACKQVRLVRRGYSWAVFLLGSRPVWLYFFIVYGCLLDAGRIACISDEELATFAQVAHCVPMHYNPNFKNNSNIFHASTLFNWHTHQPKLYSQRCNCEAYICSCLRLCVLLFSSELRVSLTFQSKRKDRYLYTPLIVFVSTILSVLLGENVKASCKQLAAKILEDSKLERQKVFLNLWERSLPFGDWVP